MRMKGAGMGRADQQSHQLDRVVALRMSPELFRRVRLAARSDDRPLSAYLRRLIEANVYRAVNVPEARDGR